MTPPDLTLDLNGLLHEATGIDSARLESLSSRAGAALRATQARTRSREVGFPTLPDVSHAKIDAHVNALDPSVSTLVVIGIGGSSLGPVAVEQALAEEGARRKLVFLDNPDPDSVRRRLDRPLADCHFAVITKSGGTAETIALASVAAQRVVDALGQDALRQRFVVVTDPVRGPLRSFAETNQLASFEVPANVGGRFSVLSPVGLFPAAFIGVDIAALLAGAADMRDRCQHESLLTNPALLWAAALYLQDTVSDRRIVTMMPYADRLAAAADWFRQLWAESLGKRDGDGGTWGPTPICSPGAVDQHSQLQLYTDGPDDKVYITMAPSDRGRDLEIPTRNPLAAVEEFGYLHGHGLGQLLDAELRGTEGALIARKRPLAKLRLAALTPRALGAYFMLSQYATVFAAELYGVNAYDQPGVEHSKRLAYGALGRQGYEAEARECEQSVYEGPYAL